MVIAREFYYETAPTPSPVATGGYPASSGTVTPPRGGAFDAPRRRRPSPAGRPVFSAEKMTW